MTNIKRKLWGRCEKSGTAIYKYTITNGSGAFVELCSVGAAIVSINVPDKKGRIGNVALGYAKAEDYFYDGPCSGKIPGRYANRIAGGKMTLDGKTFKLPVNNGPNHLHGGPEGFQNRIWESRKHKGGVEFMYFSEDGEMGYPGNMKVIARYTWSENNELSLTMTARTDAKTVVNLTNHVYFNLNCHGSCLGHFLKLESSAYLPTDETLIPLGEPEAVAKTPMDFRKPKTLRHNIGEDFPALKYGKGYDACWLIDSYDPGQLNKAAELRSNSSGRTVKIFTTQPGIQVYTGNWLEGCPKGKHGKIYHDYDCVALECQHFPDSPNHPEYPSTTLVPGTVFKQAIVWAFGTV